MEVLYPLGPQAGVPGPEVEVGIEIGTSPVEQRESCAYRLLILKVLTFAGAVLAPVH